MGCDMAIFGNITRELFVEGIVDVARSLRGKLTGEAVGKFMGKWIENIGAKEDLDEQWFDQGVAAGINSSPSRFTLVQYETHQRRVRAKIHPEKLDQYRIFSLGYKTTGEKARVDPDETAKIIAIHVAFSDKAWDDYVATRKLDVPLIQTLDIEATIKNTRTRVDAARNRTISWKDGFNPIKWFTLP